MTAYELLDLLASNFEKIDVLWNFFIWIHLAALGGLMLTPRRLSLLEIVVILLAYAGFSYTNWTALLDIYAYHAVLLEEIARLELAPEATGGLIKAHLAGWDLPTKIAFLDYSHPVAAAVVAVAFLTVNHFVRRPAD